MLNILFFGGVHLTYMLFIVFFSNEGFWLFRDWSYPMKVTNEALQSQLMAQSQLPSILDGSCLISMEAVIEPLVDLVSNFQFFMEELQITFIPAVTLRSEAISSSWYYVLRSFQEALEMLHLTGDSRDYYYYLRRRYKKNLFLNLCNKSTKAIN